MPSSSVAELYASTLLGGGVSCATRIDTRSRGCSSVVLNMMRDDCRAQCVAIAALRSLQVVLDILVRRPTKSHARKASGLCTPHFPHDLTRLTPAHTRWSRRSVRRARMRIHARGKSVRKVTPLTKTRLDLAMRLWYTLQRCLRRGDMSRGALLPYRVTANNGPHGSTGRSTAPDNHANFIYLRFENTGRENSTTVRCVLVEPNGPAAARAYKDGLSRLRVAWAQLVNEGVVVKGQQLQLEPRVRILGERNAHTVKEVERNLHALIGPRAVSTRRYRSRSGRIHTTTSTRYLGHGGGICGAVTHWIVHKWLDADATRSLEDVYIELCTWAAAAPQEALKELTTFMKDIHEQTRVKYSDLVDKALRHDLAALQTALRTKYGSTLNGERVTITCTYTFRRGKDTIYNGDHTIVVQ